MGFFIPNSFLVCHVYTLSNGRGACSPTHCKYHRTHVLPLFYLMPLPLHEHCSWVYYKCWLAECCFLLFQFSITYSGCKMITAYWGCKVIWSRQEKRLSPGQINSPTSPDQNSLRPAHRRPGAVTAPPQDGSCRPPPSMPIHQPHMLPYPPLTEGSPSA